QDLRRARQRSHREQFRLEECYFRFTDEAVVVRQMVTLEDRPQGIDRGDLAGHAGAFHLVGPPFIDQRLDKVAVNLKAPLPQPAHSPAGSARPSATARGAPAAARSPRVARERRGPTSRAGCWAGA